MKSIVLALETGIYGGSICLSADGLEIDGWVGREQRVETGRLLEIVSALIKKNNLKVGDIKTVVVSSGPGSYTGLRIGYSVALGLKASLSNRVESRFLLDELLDKTRPITMAAALPFSKNEIIWKVKGDEINFHDKKHKIFINSLDEFINEITNLKLQKLIIPQELFDQMDKYKKCLPETVKIDFCDINFAKVLARSVDVQQMINKGGFLQEIFYPKTINKKICL